MMRRIFARFSTNLQEKLFCDFCLLFSPTKIMKIFVWCALQTKRSLFVFQQTLGVIFWGITTLGAILPGFSGKLPKFSGILPIFAETFPGFLTNQNFCGCACTHEPPPSTPLRLVALFTVSAGAHSRLFWNRTTRQLLQLNLHWWQVHGSTVMKQFLAPHHTVSKSSLWPVNQSQLIPASLIRVHPTGPPFCVFVCSNKVKI